MVGMSIRVNDFQWIPGKNDAEYIKLLESSRNEWQKIAQKAIAKLKALSKAQEPVKPCYEKTIKLYICGQCGVAIGVKGLAKYCINCGKAVKWE